MAQLTLTIEGITEARKQKSDKSGYETCDSILSMSVVKEVLGYLACKVPYKIKGTDGEFVDAASDGDFICEVSIKEVHLLKKMYSPNEFIADILIKVINTEKQYQPSLPRKSTVESLFAKKKVSLSDTDDNNKTGTIFDDYYVHDIIPRYYTDRMYVTLKIYSPDKIMTLKKYCRVFVAKKLGEDIVEGQIDNFPLPYDSSKNVGYDYTCMKHLLTKEMAKDETTAPATYSMSILQEHIFPLLVQYNESFYDFLARTTNRWGEFLYYEDNKLNLGYEKEQLFLNNAKGYPSTRVTEPRPIADDKYDHITYRDLTSSQPAEKDTGDYLGEAPYDINILKSIVKRDDYDAVKGTIKNMFDSDNGADTYWMKKVNQLLTNNKPISQFVVDTLVDDTVEYLQRKAVVDSNNKRIADNYLGERKDDNSDWKTKPKLFDDIPHHDEQYDEKPEKYNEFSELEPLVDATTYQTILEGEIKAEKNIVDIEFGTSYPSLKLGDLFSVNSRNYIVTEVEAYNPEVLYQETPNSNVFTKGVDVNKVLYRVSGIAEDSTTEKDSSNNYITQYFPIQIPSGHVRTSGPQVAVVVDVDDPCRYNRVRVFYPWQLYIAIDKRIKELKDKIDNDSSLTDSEKSKKKDEVDKDYKISSYEEFTVTQADGLDLSDASPWLFYATPNGPKGAGVHARHYLAEKVLVDYAHGNIERPFVVGAVSKDIPGSIKTGSAVLQAPNAEAIKVHEGTGSGVAKFLLNMSPAGKIVGGFFSKIDVASSAKNSNCFEGGIDIGDRYGIWNIKGSTDSRNISITSPWGDVKISAFTGITISAPNGDINIKGKNVTIDAGNNLKLISGTNINNKFASIADGTGEDIAANLAWTVANAVTKKLMELGLSVIDFSFLRNVLEVFFRPLEGSMIITSNRFLRLGAGGCDPGLPDEAYDDPKAHNLKEIYPWDYNSFKAKAIASIIKTFPEIVDYVIACYIRNYVECISAKKKLDKSIDKLKTYAKDDGKPPVCNEYADLLNLFWKDDKKEITMSDLAFKDQVKDDASGTDLDDAIRRHHLGPLIRPVGEHHIRSNRKKLKKDVAEKANILLKKIQFLKTTSSFSWQIYMSGLVTASVQVQVPAGYVNLIKKSFSKEYCKYSPIYQAIAFIKADGTTADTDINDDRLKLENTALDTIIASFTADQKKELARMAAVGFLDLLGYKETTETDVSTSKMKALKELFTSENDFKDPTWNTTIAKLILNVPIKHQTDRNFVTKNFLDNVQKAVFWKNLQDYFSWGDAKKGKILFSSGTPYVLEDVNKEVNTVFNKGVLKKEDFTNSKQNEFNDFIAIIKTALTNIGSISDDNFRQNAIRILQNALRAIQGVPNLLGQYHVFGNSVSSGIINDDQILGLDDDNPEGTNVDSTATETEENAGIVGTNPPPEPLEEQPPE